MIVPPRSPPLTQRLPLALHPLLHTSAAALFFHGGGEAERAIEWAERGLRLSPFDPWAFAAFGSVMLGHFHRSRYEEAAAAAYKAVQANPAHSINYVLLAAALVKIGRIEEAKTAAARVMELHPGFRYTRQFSGVDCAAPLAASLGDALRATGLPE